MTPSRELDPGVVKPPGTAAPALAKVGPTVEVSTTPTFSPSAELERLAELHARGVLDDEEFNAAKKRVLGSSPQ